MTIIRPCCGPQRKAGFFILCLPVWRPQDNVLEQIDELTDRLTVNNRVSSAFLVLMYIAHVCLQAATAPYGQHSCVFVCVFLCVKDGKKKPYRGCVPLIACLDSNCLRFSLLASS